MHDTLTRLHWDRVEGWHDLNRKMPVWMHRVGALSSLPDVPVIAEQPDAYNGSFNTHQVGAAALLQGC